jgi:electron transfer flavoprotein alpha subunit
MARRCGDVSWLILGESPNNATDIAAKYGVATIHEISDTRVGKGGPDATVEALAQYCTHHGPRLALFSQDFESRLIAPRLAGRLGTPVAMNAIHLDIGDNVTRVTASAYGGDTHAKYCMTGPAPHIVAVMPNAVTPEPGATPSNPVIVEFTVALSAIEERIRVVTPAKREGPRLEDAKVIVAGGRGLGDPSKFRLIEELAEAIGGMPAASRPLVDDGWTDAARQVGLTGRITRPALYMAFGISGASQHMAGCSAAKTIVAVNRDPDAAIFRFARYGIVGDCLDIIPELIAAVREP